jgi:streptomycin 6-kinase
LPGRLAAAVDRWTLCLGAPYEGGNCALVAPATLADGAPAVLKLPFPDRESEHEADALERWNGDGAVRLLGRDDGIGAMLIERCLPGTRLAEADPDEALGVLIGLLPRLWKPAGEPFMPLRDEAVRWADGLPAQWDRAGRPFERRLLDAAVETLRALSGSQDERVLLHQDLHGGNVLRAGREPWLVIDPKPLVGERAFGLAPIVRSPELGPGRAQVLRRLDRLSVELGVDRERARGWALGQTVAWAFENDRVLPGHLETARWLLGPRVI